MSIRISSSLFVTYRSDVFLTGENLGAPLEDNSSAGRVRTIILDGALLRVICSLSEDPIFSAFITLAGTLLVSLHPSYIERDEYQ
ncbi:hypothetical protein SDC9_182361 [bioreactor metagenome]|uniref:Uncharacterized protein n=1 Tax=bioreactor metagenome TaxID=1076179 RepID=A0A645H753_9ZZZZ